MTQPIQSAVNRREGRIDLHRQNPIGFNGALHEPDGWQLLGNGRRLYNPILRRFHSPDSLSPFGKGGINAYAYCSGDPINSTDPTGAFPLLTFAKALTRFKASLAKARAGKISTPIAANMRPTRPAPGLAVRVETPQPPSFANLPDVALRHIMRYLPKRDRANLVLAHPSNLEYPPAGTLAEISGANMIALRDYHGPRTDQARRLDDVSAQTWDKYVTATPGSWLTRGEFETVNRIREGVATGIMSTELRKRGFNPVTMKTRIGRNEIHRPNANEEWYFFDGKWRRGFYHTDAFFHQIRHGHPLL